MGILSVHDCGDSILIADEDKAIGRLPKKNLHPVGLAAFLRTNYNLHGSVNYQSWLTGVLAGAVLILGPPALPSEDQTEAATAGPDPERLPGEIIVPGHTVIDGQVVQSVAESVDGLSASNIRIDELTGDGSGEAAKLATGGCESLVLSSDADVPAAKADEIAPAPEASGAPSPWRAEGFGRMQLGAAPAPSQFVRASSRRDGFTHGPAGRVFDA